MATPIFTAAEREERESVAFHACAETHALIQTLRRESGEDGFEFVLRGALSRMEALTSVCMSVVGKDDGRDTSELQEAVFGKAEVFHG